MSGQLPDPGFTMECKRCGEPRQAHGGAKHLGLCPGQHGLYGRRYRLASPSDTEDWKTDTEGREAVLAILKAEQDRMAYVKAEE